MDTQAFDSSLPLPQHIAIIMDGNGRWARQRGLRRIEGHRRGADAVRDVVRASREIGVSALTLFAFSEQNWERPQDEVKTLMALLYRYVLEEQREIMENGIRLTTIGDVDRLPIVVRKALSALMSLSEQNDGMTLCLALSYSAQRDMVSATRQIAEAIRTGSISSHEVTEQLFARHLTTARLPSLDLLIRTSGEYRLSDFLLWEAAFAELFFTPVMWPEFRRQHLFEAISAFQQRERRFGRTSEQLARVATS